MLAGAILGWWFFGWRGTLLFGGLALVAMVVTHLISRRRPGLAGTLALLTAAALFQSSPRRAWGGADVPDGTRYKVSPIGLSHALTPNRTVSETVDCGWYAASAGTASCEVASAGAFQRLRLVFPLMMLAALACVLAAGLSLHSRWRLHAVQRGLGVGAAVAALVAVPLFVESVGKALTALQGLAPGMGGTLGVMQLVTGVLLGLVVFTTRSPSPRTNHT